MRALAAAVLAALVAAPAAFAHAEVSPTQIRTGRTTPIALTVPTESATAATVRVEIVAPRGLELLGATTWTGRTRGVVRLRLSARADRGGDYPLRIIQTYSDGSVVSWSGREGSANPAPVVHAAAAENTNRDRLVILLLAAIAVVGWFGLRRLRERA